MSTEHDLTDIPDPFAEELAALEAMPAPPELAKLPPSPSRERLQARRLGMLLMALASVTAVVVVMRLRGDLATGSRVGFFVALLGPLAGGAIALLAALRGGRAGMGATRGALLGATALAVLAFALSAALGARLAQGGAGAIEPSWLANGVCAALGVALASAPMLLAVAALRGAFPVVSRLRASLVGLACGALAAAALHAHCPYDGVVHVLVGHGFAMLACALVAAGLARLLRA